MEINKKTDVPGFFRRMFIYKDKAQETSVPLNLALDITLFVHSGGPPTYSKICIVRK
jgi:hypothetical protein